MWNKLQHKRLLVSGLMVLAIFALVVASKTFAPLAGQVSCTEGSEGCACITQDYGGGETYQTCNSGLSCVNDTCWSINCEYKDSRDQYGNEGISGGYLCTVSDPDSGAISDLEEHMPSSGATKCNLGASNGVYWCPEGSTCESWVRPERSCQYGGDNLVYSDWGGDVVLYSNCTQSDECNEDPMYEMLLCESSYHWCKRCEDGTCPEGGVTTTGGAGGATCEETCETNDPCKVAECNANDECVIEDKDGDGDGAPDCSDGCPSDPDKTDPGACGCGAPDCAASDTDEPICCDEGLSCDIGFATDADGNQVSFNICLEHCSSDKDCDPPLRAGFTNECSHTYCASGGAYANDRCETGYVCGESEECLLFGDTWQCSTTPTCESDRSERYNFCVDRCDSTHTLCTFNCDGNQSCINQCDDDLDSCYTRCDNISDDGCSSDDGGGAGGEFGGTSGDGSGGGNGSGGGSGGDSGGDTGGDTGGGNSSIGGGSSGNTGGDTGGTTDGGAVGGFGGGSSFGTVSSGIASFSFSFSNSSVISTQFSTSPGSSAISVASAASLSASDTSSQFSLSFSSTSLSSADSVQSDTSFNSSVLSVGTHYTCRNNACVLVLTPGESSCTTNADCAGVASSSAVSSRRISAESSVADSEVSVVSSAVASSLPTTSSDTSSSTFSNFAFSFPSSAALSPRYSSANSSVLVTQFASSVSSAPALAQQSSSETRPRLTTPVCGNGIVEISEECDDGNRRDGDGCDSSCFFTTGDTGDTLVAAASVCGNGMLEEREECDDGNRRNNDGCNEQCLLEVGICGDGKVQTLLGEQCEASQTMPPDVRCQRCRFVSNSCGNGSVEIGEECDEGSKNSDAPDATCRTDCGLPRCGDGILDTGEQCDDGNNRNGDGCSRTCRIESDAQPTQVAGQQVQQWNDSTSPQGNQLLADFYQQTGNYPNVPTYNRLPTQLPLAQLQPLIQQQGPVGDTGPAAVVAIGAGAASGFAYMRRKKRK